VAGATGISRPSPHPLPHRHRIILHLHWESESLGLKTLRGDAACFAAVEIHTYSFGNFGRPKILARMPRDECLRTISSIAAL